MRIGHGYDVHRLVPNRKLVLGGVTIPYERGLDGHSDADVLVHAIADALLGAVALGDIGKLFPTDDDSFLNADSIVLLKKVVKLLKSSGYSVINVDSTVIAERPRLSEYTDEMRSIISKALNVEKDAVSVKATTEERLGFTGSGQGISAHAVCLIDGTQK